MLIVCPGPGNDSFSALTGKPIMIGSDTRKAGVRMIGTATKVDV